MCRCNDAIKGREFPEVVFSYCGTISLSKEIKPVNDLNNLQAGDV